MTRRIIHILIALAAVLILYDIYQLTSGYGELSNMSDEYIAGNKDGDLDVVEFYDYDCVHCRKIHPVITEAVRRDGNVRYILRPLISNENSLAAGKTAYAAGMQGKFLKMHDLLMENYRAINDDILEGLAERAGLDFARLKEDTESKAVEDALRNNMRLFGKVKGEATPTFIMGPRLFYVPRGGMPDVDDFLKLFHEARQKP